MSAMTHWLKPKRPSEPKNASDRDWLSAADTDLLRSAGCEAGMSPEEVEEMLASLASLHQGYVDE